MVVYARYVHSDRNSESNPRGKFVKTVFQDVGKSEKTTIT